MKKADAISKIDELIEGPFTSLIFFRVQFPKNPTTVILVLRNFFSITEKKLIRNS